MLHEHTAGDVAAQADSTVDVDGLGRIQFADAAAEFVNGYIDGAGDVAFLVFFVGHDVQNGHFVAVQFGQVLDVVDVDLFGEDVFSDIAGHIDGVFG